jgi:hypothetical protein
MKIHFFNEDTHLPRKISKWINSHLITRTANEKPRGEISLVSVPEETTG